MIRFKASSESCLPDITPTSLVVERL